MSNNHEKPSGGDSFDRAAPPARQERSIFDARARALAQEPPAPPDLERTLEVLRFQLSSENYALETRFIREVYHLTQFTPLPGTPPFVLGIINLRGEIISVVDLKKFFSLPAKGLGELNKVIIVRDKNMEFGVLADAVLEVGRLSLDDIQPAPPTVTGIGSQYLRGVTSEGLIILDIQSVLDDERLTVHQEAG